MSKAIARITGYVTHVSIRTGQNDRGPWRMTEAIVLVAGRETVTVTVPDDALPPSNGDEVDYLVEITSSSFGPRLRVLDNYPAESTV